MKIVRDVCN
jgi:hypothetical protein